MPRFFSYVDTALRIIHMNRSSIFDKEQQNAFADFLTEAESSHPVKESVLFKNLTHHFQNDPEMGALEVHEFHHYLQTLFYPFLFVINWLEYAALMRLKDWLRSEKTEKLFIGQFRISRELENNLTFLAQKFQYKWMGSQLQIHELNEDTPITETFCLNDLIEDVTTLFQYKITADDPSPEDYFIWTQNPKNKGYKRMYRLMLKKLSKKDAYELLPLLVQTAFYTTEPLSAFCNAINIILYEFPDHGKMSRADLFVGVLARLETKLPRRKMDPDQDYYIQKLPVSVLTHDDLDAVVSFSDKNQETLHYPPAYHALKLGRELKKDPSLAYSLLNADKKEYKKLANLFFPYAIHYYLLDLNGRNSFFYISPEFADKLTPFGVEYKSYIRELTKIVSVTQAIFRNVQHVLPHNCHHHNCSYYSINLCRKWSSVPANHESCSFPSWFEAAFYRRINLKDHSFDRITPREVELARERYTSLGFKERKFNYIFRDNIYSFNIDNRDFKDSPDRLNLKKFINFLREEKMLSLEDLSGKISLDFYGYEHDTREVFEIPEIQEWLVQTRKELPELLYYINFSSASINSVMIIFPVFVKYLKEIIEGQVNILFDPNELNIFIHHEIIQVQKFCISQKIDLEFFFKQIEHINNGFKN